MSHSIQPASQTPAPPSVYVHSSAPLPLGAPLPGAQQEDDEIDLRDVWQTLRRNWLLIAGCFALAVAAGWLITGRIRPVYQASATLRIDETKTTLPGLDLLQQLGGGENEVSTEMEELRSRTLAGTVVDSMRLRLRLAEPARVRRSEIVAAVTVADSAAPAVYRFDRRPDGSFAVTRLKSDLLPEAPLGAASAGAETALPGVALRLAPAARELERFELEVVSRIKAIDDFQAALSVSRPNREASMIAVRYRGTDAEQVRDVPNLLAESFLASRVSVQKTGARSTVDFLRMQLDTIAGQLRRAEDALRAFRESEQVVSLDAEAGAQVTRLAELQAQRNDLEAERAALAHILAEVRAARVDAEGRSPYRRLLAFPTLIRNPAASSLLGSLTALDNQRAELRLRRTAQDPDVIAVEAQIAALEAQVRDLVQTYADGLGRQVASADAALAGFGERLERIPAKEVQFARLQRNAVVLGEIHTLLQTRLKESEIAQAVEDKSARIVDAAFLPELPVAPRKGLNLALAGLLGLMLGVGAAFGREWMDGAIHSQEDVQQATGLSVLGLIPHIGGKRKVTLPRIGAPRRALPGGAGLATNAATGRAVLVAGNDPQHVVTEAYRALRTNLTFARVDRPLRTLVFTSPAPGDGKTTSVSNLAATLAQQGIRVIAIDADMRRGMLHQDLGGRRGPGLSELLIGKDDLAETIQTLELGAGGSVDFVGTGQLPPNPSELLGGGRLRQLLDRLEPLYDVILIDCAPVNLVTDAAVVGTQVDGVILVTRAGKTQKGELAFAMNQLRNVRVPVVGAVLNDFDVKRDARYGGAYAYYAAYSAAKPESA
jgi:capsular exopolysaccharide synthesis family protein